ncbi:uncharacterized protein LOC115441739 [Manduca sexta]|uniref:uncharacterized protein LOC115441739 n=1 Tax=Manduca sexta TaxID=7130 RepID=UPI00188FD990|nr:uncharacterized protein LOC115441739 [Manduca sexta]
MGDIIEFTTSPSLGLRSFKVSSSGINFDVKTADYATIILSRTPLKKDITLVRIDNDRSWIGINPRDRVTAKTPDIIAGNFYSRLWLSWAGDNISLGKDGFLEPVLKYSSKTPKYMYVTFLTEKGYHHTVHWKVELPPLLKEPPMNNISKGDVHWVPTNTQLPDDVLIGGFEKENLYIIRANHRGSFTPGKFVPSEGCGYLAWGGEAHEKTEFEVLCGYNCEWVATGDDRIPVGAVEGGYSEVRREVLYVGRALYYGHIIPGKVQPSHRVCYIPFNGKEIAVKNFEVLTVPSKNRYANKYILPNHSNHMVDMDDEEFDVSEEEEEDGIMWQ